MMNQNRTFISICQYSKIQHYNKYYQSYCSMFINSEAFFPKTAMKTKGKRKLSFQQNKVSKFGSSSKEKKKAWPGNPASTLRINGKEVNPQQKLRPLTILVRMQNKLLLLKDKTLIENGQKEINQFIQQYAKRVLIAQQRNGSRKTKSSMSVTNGFGEKTKQFKKNFKTLSGDHCEELKQKQQSFCQNESQFSIKMSSFKTRQPFFAHKQEVNSKKEKFLTAKNSRIFAKSRQKHIKPTKLQFQPLYDWSPWTLDKEYLYIDQLLTSPPLHR